MGKTVTHSTWAYGNKVFIKIQDKGNKEEMKHFSQLTSHIFNFDDWYSLFLLTICYYRRIQNPVKRLVWHIFIWKNN